MEIVIELEIYQNGTKEFGSTWKYVPHGELENQVKQAIHFKKVKYFFLS